MAWESVVYLGTGLDDPSFLTLNELFSTDEIVEPDVTFEPFADYHDDLNGLRVGVGLPRATLKWNAIEDRHVEALRALCPDASARLYVRIPTNSYDIYDARLYRTFYGVAIWPTEDKQAGATLGFQLDFRRLVIQSEI